MVSRVTTHDEWEHKFEADEVELERFLEWGWAKHPQRYLHVVGPDAYYTQGGHVVRHRVSPEDPTGELTVKSRRSTSNTEDCQEIDLKFAEGCTINDVQAFLLAAGFKRAFTLVKSCHIFWYRHHSVVLYDVWPLDRREASRRFIEIEVEKDSNLPTDRAMKLLREESALVEMSLNVGKRSNKRLYEIYSGKRYKMQKEKPPIDGYKALDELKRRY